MKENNLVPKIDFALATKVLRVFPNCQYDLSEEKIVVYTCIFENSQAEELAELRLVYHITTGVYCHEDCLFITISRPGHCE